MPGWFRDATPLVIYCRFPDCHRMVQMKMAFAPERCPGCARMKKDGGEWWTIERPEGKPIKGVLSDKDLEFLRCQRIAPWEGGIDTE